MPFGLRTRSRGSQIYYFFQLPTPAPPGYLGLLQGNPNLLSEVVDAYEAGYRRRFGDRFHIDVATFRNRYSRLDIVLEIGAPSVTGSTLLFPVIYGNSGRAASEGLEFAATWQVSRQWKIDGSYSWFFVDNLGLPASLSSEDTAPHHQVKPSFGTGFWSWGNFSADLEGFYLSAIDLYAIRSNVRLNVNFRWRLSPRTDLGFAMNNLTNSNQIRFLAQDTVTEMHDRRTAELKMSWRF